MDVVSNGGVRGKLPCVGYNGWGHFQRVSFISAGLLSM